jgi:hypothetical protein
MDYEEGRSRMSLIAIKVLLDPDAVTAEKARATNARLREDYPDRFTLDASGRLRCRTEKAL